MTKTSISNNSVYYKNSLNIKTVLFQVIQFSISMHFSSILPIDRALSGATTLSQSGTGSDGNEGVLCIPQSSSIIGTSPSDCLVSYPGHLLGVRVLPLCKDTIGIFYNPSQLGKTDCFIVSQLFSVARHAGRFKMETNLANFMLDWQLYRSAISAICLNSSESFQCYVADTS